MVTAAQLHQIMPAAGGKVEVYLPFLAAALDEFQIRTPLRAAAFLAQLAHESGEFRYMEELASGRAYEGRRDLGNTEPGDGKRYKGRGPIQVTGRANYALYGKLLGLPLLEQPQLAATKEVGFRIAGLYWKRHGLNELADQGRFKRITYLINGGYNHLAEREAYYRTAKRVLGVSTQPEVSVPTDDTPYAVLLGDAPVTLADDATIGFKKDERIWVPCRAVADRLEVKILRVEPPQLLLEGKGGQIASEVEILGGQGFCPVRDLARAALLTAYWEPAQKRVRIA